MMTSWVPIASRPMTFISLPSKFKYPYVFRVVLQRQFFEAIVRAAAVKYSNRSDLPTLADKLDTLFKNKLSINATKNKAKSPEEEVSLIMLLITVIETIQAGRQGLRRV
jgi:hypothetical protein